MTVYWVASSAGHPTMLVHGRAWACCAYSRCGTGRLFFFCFFFSCCLYYLPFGVYSFHLSVHPFVCSFIRNSIPFVELLFTLKQLKWGIFHQPLIRKHFHLDHRYPRGLAFIPWILTPGSMPQGGFRGQNLGHLLKKCFSTFSVMEQLMQLVGQTWLNLVTWTCGSWSEGQHDLYFMV